MGATERALGRSVAGRPRAPVGIVFGSLTPPETMTRTARLAEEFGYGELWFSEDCLFSGTTGEHNRVHLEHTNLHPPI